jgi:hypothetical protein
MVRIQTPACFCFQCGKKTDEYLFNCEECDQKVVLKIKCDVCHRLYHTNDLCPHLWRSMEFTVSIYERLFNLNLLKPSLNLLCGLGHYFIFVNPHIDSTHSHSSCDKIL